MKFASQNPHISHTGGTDMTEIQPTPGGDPATAAPTVGSAPPEPRTSRFGRGFLPAAASLYLPGLGQLIAGERRRASLWFAAWLACVIVSMLMLAVPALVIGLVVMVPAQLVLTLACVVDAFRRGRASQGRMLGPPVLRYLAGVAFILAGMFMLHPAMPVAMWVRAHVAEAFVLPSTSMSPTIAPGDRILVQKRVGELQRWDIVAFNSPDIPGQKFVLRVAGLPGETVEVVGNELHINGAPVAPPAGVGPYQEPPWMRGRKTNASHGQALTLRPDEYFLLGDNSAIARDGRYWDASAESGRSAGALPRDRIIGKVTTRYWPWSRWKRF